MSRGLKWKLVAAFVAVFIAGAVIGAFGVLHHAAGFLLGPPHPELIGDRMRAHLRSELKLTPEQMQKVGPLIDETARQLDAIRMDTTRRVEEAMAGAHRKMAVDLTPEQQERMKAMEHKHLEWMSHRRPPPPPPPQSDGPPDSP